MAVVVIAGESNSGKTTSLRFLPPKETFLINMNHSKDPTFPGFKKNFPEYKKEMVTKPDGSKKVRVFGHYCKVTGDDKYAFVRNVINAVDKGMPHIKYLVVDDINYIMGDDIMSRIMDKSRDKFSGFAKNYTDLIDKLKSLRPDLDVIIVSHTMKEEFNDGEVVTRLMSVVKSIDKYKPIDSQFDYIFYCECLVDDITGEVEYKYRTRKIPGDSCRSVLGVFKDKYIEPNIYKALQRIHAVEDGTEPPEYPNGSDFSGKKHKPENVGEAKPEKGETAGEEKPKKEPDEEFEI